MTEAKDELAVVYKFVNGSHFFVGDEGCKFTQGLCVGSRDLKDAFDQVTPALQFLLKANFGIDAACFGMLKGLDGKTMLEELEARGYDMTTLRFSIQKKQEGA